MGNSSSETTDIWKSAKLLYILGHQFAIMILNDSLLNFKRK